MTATVGDVATLAHGFTMADIESATRLAIHKYPRSTAMLDKSEMWDTAWFAVVERLYGPGPTPNKGDLIFAGMDGLAAALSKQVQYRGLDSHHQMATRPSFSNYWRHVPHDFTEKVDDRIALAQVLSQLTDAEYEVLATYAVMGTNKDTALALRIERHTASERLAKVRAKLTALWLAPDTPRSKTMSGRGGQGSDEACQRGHKWAEHGALSGAGVRFCTICRRATTRAAATRRRAREFTEQYDVA